LAVVIEVGPFQEGGNRGGREGIAEAVGVLRVVAQRVQVAGTEGQPEGSKLTSRVLSATLALKQAA
jgi:hypothetical protein